MRKPLSGRRLAAAALSAVALAGCGLAMAPAASAATAPAGAPAAQVKPDANPNSCISTLTQWGYAATTTRIIICNTTAVAAFVNAENAFVACVPALAATIKDVNDRNYDVLTSACFLAAYG
ncbi:MULTISPECIES: hypothetical protein [unclassified Streptomyces]|uniref:hypothetical protein n=1 Tax=unclassified Streptomyces TaxID=2593676 RepID=UPI0033A50BE0